MERRKKEECAQRDGRTPTVSCDVAVAFPLRHRALHHRWVFLQVPSLSIRPPCRHPHPLSLSSSLAPRRKPDLLVFSSTWSDKSWEWGPSMIRLRVANRKGEEKRGDGWIGGRGRGGGGEGGPGSLIYRRQVTDGVCFSQACTCAGGRFSWVLHKGGMGLPGPDAALRTHKLSWNYPGAEIYRATTALLILAKPIISALLLRRRGGGRGGGERGKSKVGAR